MGQTIALDKIDKIDAILHNDKHTRKLETRQRNSLCQRVERETYQGLLFAVNHGGQKSKGYGNRHFCPTNYHQNKALRSLIKQKMRLNNYIFMSKIKYRPRAVPNPCDKIFLLYRKRKYWFLYIYLCLFHFPDQLVHNSKIICLKAHRACVAMYLDSALDIYHSTVQK